MTHCWASPMITSSLRRNSKASGRSSQTSTAASTNLDRRLNEHDRIFHDRLGPIKQLELKLGFLWDRQTGHRDKAKREFQSSRLWPRIAVDSTGASPPHGQASTRPRSRQSAWCGPSAPPSSTTCGRSAPFARKRSRSTRWRVLASSACSQRSSPPPCLAQRVGGMDRSHEARRCHEDKIWLPYGSGAPPVVAHL